LLIDGFGKSVRHERCLVDLFILRDLMGEQSPPCASFLSVTEYKDRVHQQDHDSQ
jgi:hypothetical protein